MNASALSAIIIGNEVLTAKVDEANGAHLIRRCRERGITLHSLHVVRDDVDAIVEQVQACRRHVRYVVTSGGVGPTHDDVTVRAVALALGKRVVRLPELEALIRAYFGSRPVPVEALRMAEGPEGSTPLPTSDRRLPVLACDGVFMLPGVPALFRMHLETVVAQLPGVPVVLRQLFLDRSESDIAKDLDEVAKAFPHVAIGSYPTFGEGLDYRVKLTVEHVSEAEANKVFEALRSRLSGGVVRVEPGL